MADNVSSSPGDRAAAASSAPRRRGGHVAARAAGPSWAAGGVGELRLQGHQHHGRVVAVGIEVVGVFKAPAARLGIDGFGPIAAAA